MSATAVAAWLAVWPALLSHGDRARMLLLCGAAGAVALAAGAALRQTAGVAVGILFLGGGYVSHLAVDDPSLDARAVFVAAGLLLAAELACWSIELRREVSRQPARHMERLVAEIGVCLGGLIAAALVLVAADLGRVGGTAVEVAGVAAAVTLAWLALGALRRPPA